jgi:hypothetical protein
MKALNSYIKEAAQTFDYVEDYLADIVQTAKKEPDVYDDTGDWEARDGFEYWESAFGEFQDVCDFIDEYGSGCAVAGWSSEESYEDVEKVIPDKLKTLMNKTKPKMPYKKYSNKFEVWETNDDGFDVNIMKFMNYMNDNGTDYVQYWYMIAIEC